MLFLLSDKFKPPTLPVNNKSSDNERNYPGAYENQIGGHSQPLNEAHQRLCREQRASSMPVPVAQHILQLQNAGREKVEDHHSQQSRIEAPKRYANVLLGAAPCVGGGCLTQTEYNQRNGEHSEDTHHGGVSVIR